MVEDEIGDRLDAEAVEHPEADLRVALEDEPLRIGERAGLAQDLLGDGELPEVVETAREAGELDLLGVDPVADVVLHHHERWDGAGYPEGKHGAEIPLGARIIFVADAFDAMTSDRVYRPKRSEEEALAELRRCAGTQFDPAIVSAFAEEVDEARVAPLASVG